MGRKLVDLSGSRFGRLVVLRHLGRKNHSSIWECLCDCGKTVIVQASAFKSGTTSCGCYRAQRMASLNFVHGERAGAKRAKASPEYKAWDSIKQRCNNPNSKDWVWYGGKGIKVCDRWLASFESFLEDMGPRPAGMSIERLDGMLGYSPENCVWATAKQQARNRSNNRMVSFNGRLIPLVEACELLGIPYKMAKSRLQKGWSEHDAVHQPPSRRRDAR